MRKLLLISTVLFFALMGQVAAQTRQVTGKVTSSEDGSPLPGVNITVKGSTKGTTTNADGSYKISVNEGNSLTFTFIGFKSQTVAVKDQGIVNISLVTETSQLNEVVVTALGISREKKSLGYSVASVSGSDLTQSKNMSALDALNAKVPGLSISTGSGAPGASTAINIRGYSSVTGENSPLFVVDGVPMNNRTNNGNNGSDVTRSVDLGNQMNDINPNDIESISVLKGGAASSLYGSRAANGVIVITTKKGKSGKPRIEISSSVAQSQVLRVPHLQNKYGQGWSGLFAYEENGSWGPEADGKVRPWGNIVDNSRLLKPFSIQKDNIKDFLERGMEYNNSISVSGGNDVANYRMSFSNATADGVIPTDGDSYKRNTFALGGGISQGKFTANATINYVNKKQKAINTGQGDDAGAGGVIWQEIIQIPRDHSIRDYSAVLDVNHPFYKFNNSDNFFTPYASNPYWILANTGNDYSENRVFGNIDLAYKFTNSLKLNWKIGGDFSDAIQKEFGNKNIINDGTPNSSANDVVGAVAELNRSNTQLNSDLVLSYDSKLSKDFDFNALVGYNLNERSTYRHSAYVTNLDLPGFYDLSNSSVTPVVDTYRSIKRIMGVYASSTVGYKNWMFLTVGARNDWSSTLPKGQNSYFYPSANLSAVLSDVLPMPSAIKFAKVRVGFASTGNDADVYDISPVYIPGETRTGGFGVIKFPFAGFNGYEVDNNPGNLNLKPEISEEYETGLELAFLDRRLNLDFSYYNKLTKNQVIDLTLDPASGYTLQPSNLGAVRNKGIELAIDGVPIRRGDFEWGLNFNFNKIMNNVESLGLDNNPITLNSSYQVILRAQVGYPLGAIFAPQEAKTADGNVIVNATTGLPQLSQDLGYKGSINPDFTMGFGTYVTYKNFRLSANADYRKGGVFYSYTARLNYFVGNAWNTQYNDRQPWIIPGSVVENADGSYSENTTAISRANVFTYYGANDPYQDKHVLDKTFFKLRNVTLTYTVPDKFFKNLSIAGASLGVFGRNLILWTPSENHFVDPEANTFGTSLRSMYGEFASGPSTASYGFQLNLKF